MKTKRRFIWAGLAILIGLVFYLLLRSQPDMKGQQDQKQNIQDVQLPAEAAAEKPSAGDSSAAAELTAAITHISDQSTSVDTNDVTLSFRSSPAAKPSLSSTVKPTDSTLQEIINVVKKTEDAIKDLSIEYTCVRIPYGSKGRDLTPEEQAKMDKYPGWYKPETGTWRIKGDKIMLDRTFYHSQSDAKPLRHSISYDGKNTHILTEGLDGSSPGLISPERSHNFRTFFNPIRTLTATGDKKLSGELSSMDAELASGDYEVGGVPCKMVKLYQRHPNKKDFILRTYRLYLDPKVNYAPRKTERYWYDFECLENTVEVKEFTTVNGINVPSKAICISYNRPDVTKDSIPVSEQELNATGIKVNQDGGIADSVFDLKFAVGTKVWDERFEVNYTIKE